MNLKDTYNKIAEDWNKDHQDDNWWQKGTKKFISLLKPRALVLDVGCGTGHKTVFLVKNGLKVIGIDFSEKMIEIAKRQVEGAEFRVMDMWKVDQMSESFDGIFAQACLLHVPKKDALKVIKILASKLKSGGYFYVAVKISNKGLNEEIIKENDYGYQYERFFSFYTLDEVKKYFKDLKMKIVHESVDFSGHTYWVQVIAQKEVE